MVKHSKPLSLASSAVLELSQRQAADNDDKSYFKDLFATDIHGAYR